MRPRHRRGRRGEELGGDERALARLLGHGHVAAALAGRGVDDVRLGHRPVAAEGRDADEAPRVVDPHGLDAGRHELHQVDRRGREGVARTPAEGGEHAGVAGRVALGGVAGERRVLVVRGGRDAVAAPVGVVQRAAARPLGVLDDPRRDAVARPLGVDGRDHLGRLGVGEGGRGEPGRAQGGADDRRPERCAEPRGNSGHATNSAHGWRKQPQSPVRICSRECPVFRPDGRRTRTATAPWGLVAVRVQVDLGVGQVDLGVGPEWTSARRRSGPRRGGGVDLGAGGRVDRAAGPVTSAPGRSGLCAEAEWTRCRAEWTLRRGQVDLGAAAAWPPRRRSGSAPAPSTVPVR